MMGHQQDAKFAGGFAWRNTMPGRRPMLHVNAMWVCPSSGYELELRPHPPGINPEIVLVRLTEKKPTGFVLPVLTPVETTYHIVADDPVKEVHILPNGYRLPVHEVSLAEDEQQGEEPGGIGFPAANHFELYADGVTVVYSTTSLDGSRTLTYKGQSFTGDEIKVTETPLGDLVTVVLETASDGAVTCFTLLVPPARLDPFKNEVEVSTVGVTSRDNRSLNPPFIGVGQLVKYETIGLVGRAILAVA